MAELLLITMGRLTDHFENRYDLPEYSITQAHLTESDQDTRNPQRSLVRTMGLKRGTPLGSRHPLARLDRFHRAAE